MIYIQRNGKEHGPYNETEASTYMQSGQLQPNDLARADHERNWRPLREVLGGIAPARQAGIAATAPPAVVVAPAQPGPAAQHYQPAAPANHVTVVDVRMPFGSMVVFMIKWVLASIPAMIILWIILAVVGLIISLVFGGLLGGMGAMLQQR